MDLFFDNQESDVPLASDETFEPNERMTKLYDEEPYTAYTEDLEFMWRWSIYRDKILVQEGCSLTLNASRHAVNHVLAFFNAQNSGQRQGVAG